MELNIERIAMMATLVIMGAAIGAKIVTLQLLRGMENAITVVNQMRIEVQRELQRVVSKKMSATAMWSNSREKNRRSAAKSASCAVN